MKVKTIRDVSALARKRRVDLGWAQTRLAEAVGVGREWIIDFEKGKPTVEWGLVLRALKELGMEIDLAESPRTKASDAGADLSAVLNRNRRRS
jgi:HTH-type transcriptional regulator/antitoxin HipB